MPLIAGITPQRQYNDDMTMYVNQELHVGLFYT